MPRLNVEIHDGVYQRFLRQCKADGRNVSDVIRSLILDFVERRVRETKRLVEGYEKEEEDVERRAENG